MAAAVLVQENVWVDKFRVRDAEIAYHQTLASQRSGLVIQGVGLKVGVGVDNPELQARLNAVEQENKELKKVTASLQSTVAKLTARVDALEKAAGGAPTASASEAAPAKQEEEDGDDDDDFDLFGEDDEEAEEEAEKIREERRKAAEDAKKKKKKPAVIAKSSILLDVKPWDDETDMAEIEKNVRSIATDGLVWGGSKLVPVGYGIKKLQIMCVVEDEKVGTDFLEESITAFEDLVQSVDIVAFNKI